MMSAVFTTPLRILWLESGDLRSIHTVIATGRARGIDVTHAEVQHVRFAANGGEPPLSIDGEDIIARFDAVIIRSFMPLISESLTIARFFHEAGKVVIDQSLVNEGYAMGKMHDTLRLAAAGIAVPKTIQPTSLEEGLAFAAATGYPCVLKSTFGAYGKFVFRAADEAAFREIFAREPLGRWLIQEYLPAETDDRVIVIGGTALPLFVRRRPPANDFRTNFEFQSAIVSLPLDEYPELRVLAERTATSLRREFTAVDIRCRGEIPLVLEANRRPGFFGFEQATGLSVADALLSYVERRCRESQHLVP